MTARLSRSRRARWSRSRSIWSTSPRLEGARLIRAILILVGAQSQCQRGRDLLGSGTVLHQRRDRDRGRRECGGGSLQGARGIRAAFHVATLQVQLGRERELLVALDLARRRAGAQRYQRRALRRHEHAERPLPRERHAARRQSHRDRSRQAARQQPRALQGHPGRQANAVFNGKIIVRKDAQKTDSKQTNKNLVLSDDAIINTKPELQIYADDVRCTHGATIGQLDAESLFYLQSRGIGKKEARSLLIVAFAHDIVDRIKIASLRDRWRRMFGRV